MKYINSTTTLENIDKQWIYFFKYFSVHNTEQQRQGISVSLFFPDKEYSSRLLQYSVFIGPDDLEMHIACTRRARTERGRQSQGISPSVVGNTELDTLFSLLFVSHVLQLTDYNIRLVRSCKRTRHNRYTVVRMSKLVYIYL